MQGAVALFPRKLGWCTARTHCMQPRPRRVRRFVRLSRFLPVRPEARASLQSRGRWTDGQTERRETERVRDKRENNVHRERKALPFPPFLPSSLPPSFASFPPRQTISSWALDAKLSRPPCPRPWPRPPLLRSVNAIAGCIGVVLGRCTGLALSLSLSPPRV